MPTEPQSDGNSAPPAATNTTQLPATVSVTWDGDQRFDFGRPDRKAILVDGRVQGNPEASFLAKVRSAHGKGGVPVCETGDSPAALQRQLQEWRKGYPHYKLVQTGMTPL